ncbi:hypothetical protein CW304_29450 [Bacillus sp. UFRGS-B20]|nr:hypothetical protein CW304_29450 [Bacillus sp. UFRGS-B20]
MIVNVVSERIVYVVKIKVKSPKLISRSEPLFSLYSINSVAHFFALLLRNLPSSCFTMNI